MYKIFVDNCFLQCQNFISIYTITIFLQDSIGVAPSYDLYENIVFIDNTANSQLLYADAKQHYQYGDFYVNDPENLDSIISEVKQMDNTELDVALSGYITKRTGLSPKK